MRMQGTVNENAASIRCIVMLLVNAASIYQRSNQPKIKSNISSKGGQLRRKSNATVAR